MTKYGKPMDFLVKYEIIKKISSYIFRNSNFSYYICSTKL